MKKVKSVFRLTSLLLVMLTVCLPVKVFASNYCARVTAKVVGEGKVYVNYNDASDNPAYTTPQSMAEHTRQSYGGGAGNQTYHLYAQANDGCKFVGWFANEDCTGDPQSTNSHYQVSVAEINENNFSDDDSYDYYAQFAVSVNISSVGYSTLYYSTSNLIVPAGVTAYTYKVTNMLEVSHTYNADEVIPKGTAVVLQGNAGSYDFLCTNKAGTSDAENMLKGTDAAATTTGGTYYYALTLNKAGDPESIGFYWMNSTGGAFNNGAHKAYLPLSSTFAELAQQNGVKGFLIINEDDATGIHNIEADNNVDGSSDAATDGKGTAIYNLAGQRIQKMQNGINIINGKKILKK